MTFSTAKVKIKLLLYFFPNSHGYDHLSRIPESREPDFGDQEWCISLGIPPYHLCNNASCLKNFQQNYHHLVTWFLLLFWAVNQSSRPYMWRLNWSSGPFLAGLCSNMFGFSILKLILSQIFHCLYHNCEPLIHGLWELLRPFILLLVLSTWLFKSFLQIFVILGLTVVLFHILI